MIQKCILAALSAALFLNMSCTQPPTEKPNAEKPPTEKPNAEKPNIVLISIDTLRADYLAEEYMPRFHDFAQKNCLVFANAYTNVSWTLPSHTTMLSGVLPGRHGVEFEDSIIPDDVPMVQEALKRRGYRTIASTNAGYVKGFRGFSRGFDSWTESVGIPPKRNTVDTFLEEMDKPFLVAKKQLAELPESSEPTFLFLHTFLVHNFRNYLTPLMKLEREKKLRKSVLESVSQSTDKEVLDALAESVRDRRARYKAVVGLMDDVLMDFLDYLQSGPLGDNLVVIVTSDHGEGFGERYGDYISLGHGNAPFPDQSRVPLVVYGLNYRGEVGALIALTDVASMILAIADAEKDVVPENDFLILETARKSGVRSIGLVCEAGLYVWTFDNTPYLIVDGQNVDSRSESQRIGISAEEAKELKALGYLN